MWLLPWQSSGCIVGKMPWGTVIVVVVVMVMVVVTAMVVVARW